MTIASLEAQLIRYEVRDGHEVHAHVSTVAEAHGVTFLCPACFAKNGGSVGTHHVTCWFAGCGVPDNVKPLPGRWVVSGGNSIADLTIAPSIHLAESPCQWHGFITNGDAT